MDFPLALMGGLEIFCRESGPLAYFPLLGSMYQAGFNKSIGEIAQIYAFWPIFSIKGWESLLDQGLIKQAVIEV